MGAEEVKEPRRPRVVLDTNVFISAMLFGGPPARLISAWQHDKMRLLLSAPVLNEYLRVLSYPKFGLTGEEIRYLIRVEAIPFSEPVKIGTKLHIVDQDPSDNMFLELAVDGKADFVVSGDKHLLELGRYGNFEIVSVAKFLKLLK